MNWNVLTVRRSAVTSVSATGPPPVQAFSCIDDRCHGTAKNFNQSLRSTHHVLHTA